MDQDLIRHINAAKHDCNIVALLRFCTHLQILPDRRYKVLWPAVYKLLKHAAYMYKTKTQAYTTLNVKFYITLRSEYDRVRRRASHINCIPKDLASTIELHLTARVAHYRIGDFFPRRLGIIDENSNLPSFSRDNCYNFTRMQVDACDNTYKICDTTIGCKWNDHRCKTLSEEEFRRDYPHLLHSIELWNKLPAVIEP